MLLFMFLLVITRVYAPFDQALALIAEMFMSQVSTSRLMEIYDAKTAEGEDSFAPDGHDIVFENVGFAYDNEQVLRGVSFTAKEGEVTALVGPIVDGRLTKALEQDLADCYKNTLDLCLDNNIRSVAFCCISTGVFHFPNKRAAEIAVVAVTEWLKVHPKAMERVIFNVFKNEDKAYYEAELQ